MTVPHFSGTTVTMVCVRVTATKEVRLQAAAEDRRKKRKT